VSAIFISNALTSNAAATTVTKIYRFYIARIYVVTSKTLVILDIFTILRTHIFVAFSSNE